jgi:hypothetical protein
MGVSFDAESYPSAHLETEDDELKVLTGDDLTPKRPGRKPTLEK